MEENGQKEVNTSDQLKEFKNARVFWPPECPDDILDAVLAKARQILSEYDVDSDGIKIAEDLKHYMDQNFRPYWHVVCGRHFGCYSIHEQNRFLFFYVDNVAFLLYKSSQLILNKNFIIFLILLKQIKILLKIV